MTAIEPGKRPLPAPSLEEDYALLKKAVRAAGDLALTYFRKSIIVKRKVDGSEVSEADLAIDVALKIELHVPCPDYGWLSEETEDDSERLKSSRVWMVDPIDGTNAFLRHVPEWTVSAALVENGRPVLGAVFNPATNEFFHAMRGKGAFLNDKPITASDKSTLGGALLIASGGSLSWGRLVGGALTMGVGICAMHYIGMASLEIVPGIVWNAPLVVGKSAPIRASEVVPVT